MYIVTVSYTGGPRYELDNSIEKAGGVRNWEGCGFLYVQTGPGVRDHSFSWKGEGAARRAYHRLKRLAKRTNNDPDNPRVSVQFLTVDDDEHARNPYQSC